MVTLEPLVQVHQVLQAEQVEQAVQVDQLVLEVLQVPQQQVLQVGRRDVQKLLLVPPLHEAPWQSAHQGQRRPR